MAELKTSGRTLTRPAVVQLDIDDTLYDYESCHRTGLAAMRWVLETELNVSGEAFDDAFSRARADVKKRLGPTASSHSRMLYAARMLELLGMRSQPETALRLESTYWREFLHACEPFEGVDALLLELRLHDIPICVVTDLTMAIQYRKLIHLRIAELVDWVVTSEEVSGDKETGEPFALMKEKMDLADDAHVWVVGDAMADVKSLPSGASANILLRNNGRNQALEAHADVMFDDFPGLVELIRPALAKE